MKLVLLVIASVIVGFMLAYIAAALIIGDAGIQLAAGVIGAILLGRKTATSARKPARPA
jgi:hypothetical protein